MSQVLRLQNLGLLNTDAPSFSEIASRPAKKKKAYCYSRRCCGNSFKRVEKINIKIHEMDCRDCGNSLYWGFE